MGRWRVQRRVIHYLLRVGTRYTLFYSKLAASEGESVTALTT